MEGEGQVRPAAWTPSLVLPPAFHMTLGKALKQLEPHFLGYKCDPKGAECSSKGTHSTGHETPVLPPQDRSLTHHTLHSHIYHTTFVIFPVVPEIHPHYRKLGTSRKEGGRQ